MRPVHWALCREAHQNVENHYRMCIKLNKIKNLGGLKQKILGNKINLNFTKRHSNYIAAF